MAWRNIGIIRSIKDELLVRDLLAARSKFLDLRARHDIGIRKIYIDAADQVARDLRALKPTIGELTRNHLQALEKSLRREEEKIYAATQALTKSGMEEAVGLGARPIDNHLLRAVQDADVGLDFLKIQRGFGDINTAAVEALWAKSRHGLAVSERIWNQSQVARAAMRDLVHVGVAAGRDVVKVARDLERYVRQGIKTLAEDYPNMMARMGRRIPKDLCYEALRLARTEYSNAFMEGVYSRGRVNPSYQGVRFMLSDSHPEPDICDDLASADLYNIGPGVYPAGEEPAHPHPNCYSDDTEVYTNRGWKLFGELVGDELIASLNPETLKTEWCHYLAETMRHHKGKMVSVQGKNVDLLVTPDHQMFVKLQNDWEIISAIELYNRNCSFQIAYRVIGDKIHLDEGPRVNLVDYDGYVCDIQLAKNHILWVRRNGKTAWSGNCLCYVIPYLVETKDFVVQLKEWRDNPASYPKIEKWYNEIYQPVIAGRSVAGTALPFVPLPNITRAEEWARNKYPHIEWDFAGAHIDAINPTLRQFDKLAQQYPEVANRLRYIGAYGKPGNYHKYPFKNAYAHASLDGLQIGLNPHWYGNPARFKERLASNVLTGWHPKGADSIESVLTHEFGHQVYNWLLRDRQAFSIYISADGFGIVSETLHWWTENVKATARLSRYAVAGSKEKKIMESWAEAFLVQYHSKQLPVYRLKYVRLQRELLKLMGPETPRYDLSVCKFSHDLTGEERKNALKHLSELKEKVGWPW